MPDARKRACPVWGGLGGNRHQNGTRALVLLHGVLVASVLRVSFLARALGALAKVLLSEGYYHSDISDIAIPDYAT
jgi:hypothetical protein